MQLDLEDLKQEKEEYGLIIKMTTFTLFSKPKNKEIARKISITSPAAFRGSIKELQKGGLNTEEKKSLVLARTRASLQLKRHNLSPKERKQFREISKMNIPPIDHS